MKSLYNFISEDDLSKVETKYTPPEGLFLKSGKEIARQLRKDSKDDGQAMKRLVFYMNRAGKDCPNKRELNKAKKILAAD